MITCTSVSHALGIDYRLGVKSHYILWHCIDKVLLIGAVVCAQNSPFAANTRSRMCVNKFIDCFGTLFVLIKLTLTTISITK